MNGVEDFQFIGRGDMFCDLGDVLSKINDRGTIAAYLTGTFGQGV